MIALAELPLVPGVLEGANLMAPGAGGSAGRNSEKYSVQSLRNHARHPARQETLGEIYQQGRWVIGKARELPILEQTTEQYFEGEGDDRLYPRIVTLWILDSAKSDLITFPGCLHHSNFEAGSVTLAFYTDMPGR